MPIHLVPYDPKPFHEWSERRIRGAFSLLELLVVVAIIGVLMVLTMPVMQRVNEGQRMGKAVSDLTALLEYARTEALARSTYVWVGFTNRTNSSGNAELAVMVFASRDGMATAANDTIEPLTKMLHLEGIQFTDKDQLSQEVRNLYIVGTTAAVSSNASPKTLPASQGVTFDRTLTITPRGEAMLEKEPGLSTGFDNVIDISLRPMRGTVVDPASTDHASIWLYGASGRLQVYRLQ